jgi:hypothetical protein
MPYILLAVALVAFGAGFGVARTVYVHQIDGLEATIKVGNAVAENILKESINRLKESESKAAELNSELEKTHEQDISTINAIHSNLAAARLHDPGTKGCRNAVPKGQPSKAVLGDAGDNAELSEGFDGFLKSEAFRADNAAIDKNALLKFVKNNCGVK